MSKFFIFIGGIVTGVILTFLFAAFYSASSDSGVTEFEEVGDVINEKSFKVFQVIGENRALARSSKKDFGIEDFYGPIYVLTNKEGKMYYDDEIIKVPSEKEVRQIGIYQYETQDGFGKTVPIVRIMDK